jgi:hypothetical protein
MHSDCRLLNELVNFVVKLLHLTYCTVFFKENFVHVATLVVVVCYVPITYYTLEYLAALVCLCFFGPVVNRYCL